MKQGQLPTIFWFIIVLRKKSSVYHKIGATAEILYGQRRVHRNFLCLDGLEAYTQAHTRVNHEMNHILVSRFSLGFDVNIINDLNTWHTSIRFSVLSVINFYTTI